MITLFQKYNPPKNKQTNKQTETNKRKWCGRLYMLEHLEVILLRVWPY